MRDLWGELDSQGQITLCYLIALFLTVAGRKNCERAPIAPSPIIETFHSFPGG